MPGVVNKPDAAILPSKATPHDEASLTNDTIVAGDTNLANEAWVIVPDEATLVTDAIMSGGATPQSLTSSSLSPSTSTNNQAISPSDTAVSIDEAIIDIMTGEAISPSDTSSTDVDTLTDHQYIPPLGDTMPRDQLTPANLAFIASTMGPAPAPAGHKTKTETSFPRFPSLPREIRAQIWELCLPRRLIPLSTLAIARDHRNAAAETDPSQPGSDDPAIQTMIDKVMPRACRIAQVCREARIIALSQRESTAELGLLWLGRENWFDRRTDMLYVDCDVRERHKEIWEELRAKVVVGDWEGRGYGGGGGGGVRVALCNHMVKRWTPTDPPAPVLPVMELGVATRRGIRQKSWPVVMDRLTPGIGWKSPAGLGMFGLFDEECVTLLDASEDEQGGLLERLMELGLVDAHPLELAIPFSLRMASEEWKPNLDRCLGLSRELGFEGSDEEWLQDGAGPYPTLKAEKDDFTWRGPGRP
ncbi:hypothetical protein F5144DRAFT_539262 [Chaetomium tenue]|uniref:Uncharacterized protein n=1 Tax=Chaetomium tenue TaxID=1854479 RepID=A0ACB7P054_9PEZI|nr:hypothetical protein F5144DRAFT_539262 [Chaetomium globosum]